MIVVFILSALSWIRIRGLWKLPDGRDWLWGNLGLILSTENWCWSWNSNTLTTWCEEVTYWKRPWCWARLKAGGEGDKRGWDGWMASPTQWTWVWASSGNWWWTGKPGVLQLIGLQRVRQQLIFNLELSSSPLVPWYFSHSACDTLLSHGVVHIYPLFFLLYLQARV